MRSIKLSCTRLKNSQIYSLRSNTENDRTLLKHRRVEWNAVLIGELVVLSFMQSLTDSFFVILIVCPVNASIYMFFLVHFINETVTVLISIVRTQQFLHLRWNSLQIDSFLYVSCVLETSLRVWFYLF